MRILAFCPTARRLDERVLAGLVNQQSDGLYFDAMFTADNPYPPEWRLLYRNIQLNYEKMRKASEGYDKVFIVEHDMILPDGALKKLAEVDAPVVGGLYCHRHGTPVPNFMRWYEGTKEQGSSYNWNEIKWGEPMRVTGAAMGCLLVDASLVQRFAWEDESNPVAPDVPFIRFCVREGVKQYGHAGVVCGHIRPDGSVLWPDQQKGYRIA